MTDFQTPDWVCDIMVGMIDDYPDSIIEPTPGEGNLVRALYNRFPKSNIIALDDVYQYQPNKEIECACMNPPFSPMKQGFEILKRVTEWTPYIIALLPWFMLINSERRTQWFIENGLCEIIHLPRRAFPGSRVQTFIAKLISGYKGEISFNTWEVRT
ncbi:MAG: hypothetical protein GF411_00005 [Candidatus Lokiarchaeota archaeon]|nr:hypothetical protein [Candidatus Lokiarchaeota archaeon]